MFTYKFSFIEYMHCFGSRPQCSDRYRESNQHVKRHTLLEETKQFVNSEWSRKPSSIIFISKYGFVQSYILQMKANRCITPPSKTIENLSWRIASFTNRENMVTQLNSQLSVRTMLMRLCACAFLMRKSRSLDH